ncbi:exocyst complex component Sec10-domain-containing protein [Lipomyces japonicus]|uniref:exocyst complex component Sec10-domain-containing protein n=1 Tax=Lipomyces japonicus TaxID=56871 RepID=UPI0034D00540
MAVYDMDPHTRDLLSLDTFQHRITVKDLVESLSKSSAATAAAAASSSSAPLDPKPYIRTFEAALASLSTISHDLATRESQVAADATTAAAVHGRLVTGSAEQACQNLADRFAELEVVVSDVASTTTTLGEAVDLVSRQRNRAASSSFLIKSYLSFAHNNDAGLVDAMRQGSVDDQRQCAVTVRQLLRLARKINAMPHAARTRANIEKYAEMVERELLRTFDRAYRGADMDAMKHLAEILTEFNGGSSVVQIFVNQHDFFIVKEKLVHQRVFDDAEFWHRLADPDSALLPSLDNTTLSLLNEIRVTVKKESAIIKRVFPFPEKVLQVFIQRLFAQTIQQRVELLLSHADSVSALAYVRTLQACHAGVADLVSGLKKSLQPDLDPGGALAMLLDQSMQDLFVSYIENGRYIGQETKSLRDLGAGLLLAKFQAAHRGQHGKPSSQPSRNPTLLDRLGTTRRVKR